MPRFVDLSHTVEHGMVTYPGLPGPVIGDHLSRADSAGRYAAGTTFQIGRVALVSNTGTYVDAPFHRYADGSNLADLDLASLALGAGIPVVEHLRGLDAVPDEGFRFYAVPVKLRGVGSFPVRAFGLLDRQHPMQESGRQP